MEEAVECLKRSLRPRDESKSANLAEDFGVIS